jgi:circadian clock protein KaiC
MAKLDKIPFGLPKFDKIIDGGFNSGHKVTVLGAPGTGKSVFCAQFIYNGITKHNQSGVYISTQEKKKEFYDNMMNFGMDFEKAEKEKKFIFIEQGLVKAEFFDIVKILNRIQKINAKRVVFDSLNFFEVKYPDQGTRNIETLSYMRGLSGRGRVSLWVSENYEADRLVYKPEHFLSDGIIYLQHLMAARSGPSRTVTIIKLRGIKHDEKRYPFSMGPGGIDIKNI